MGLRPLAVTLALLQAGCDFEPAQVWRDGAAPDGPVGPDATDGSGPGDGTSDAGSDAKPPFCDPNDADLLLCITFEGDVVQDESPHHFPITTAGTISFVDGPGGIGRAAVLDASSRITIADGADWAPTPRLTWELWVRAQSFPGGSAERGLLDKNGEWGSFLEMGGRLTCDGRGIIVKIDGAASTTDWHRLRCVLDTDVMIAYVDGVARGNLTDSPNTTDSADPLFVGADGPDGIENYLGELDGLRVWTAARSP